MTATELCALRVDECTVETMALYAGHLMRAHAIEVGLTGDLNVDWFGMGGLESSGALILLGAWADEQLVGYAVSWMSREPFASRRIAHGGAIYVAPSHRRHGLAQRLLAESEARARSAGCASIVWHSPGESRLGAVVERRGYQPIETIYRKDLN